MPFGLLENASDMDPVQKATFSRGMLLQIHIIHVITRVHDFIDTNFAEQPNSLKANKLFKVQK